MLTTPSQTRCSAFCYVAFPRAIKYPLGIFLPKAALDLTSQKPAHNLKETGELFRNCTIVRRKPQDKCRCNGHFVPRTSNAVDCSPNQSINASFSHSRQFSPARREEYHILKNVRLQFLAKEMGTNKQITSAALKLLYKIQQGSTIKPVRFLTHKHLYPSNIEKMGVNTAPQLFSVPVTAASQYLKDQAGHTCNVAFATVGPTVTFLKVTCKWFALTDVSNTVQHIHTNF